jgi:hypothetical protein
MKENEGAKYFMQPKMAKGFNYVSLNPSKNIYI